MAKKDEAVEADLTGEPFASAAQNPIYKKVRKVVGPVVKDDDSAMIVWVEKDAAGELQTMTQDPETPMELADAEEFHRLSNWRSWRTLEDLRALVKKGKKWLIRMNTGANFWFISEKAAKGPLAKRPVNGTAFNKMKENMVNDPSTAAVFSAKEAARIVDELSRDWEMDPDFAGVFFEPIQPEFALRDMRLLETRTAGWAPRMRERYDAKQLKETFGKPVKIGKKYPFTKVADGYVWLMDGTAGNSFRIPSVCYWEAHCTKCEEEQHEACDCLPKDFRDVDQKVYVHIFARAKGETEYQYIGLGHVQPEWRNDSVRMDLVPKLRRSTFSELGGYLGWELRRSPKNQWGGLSDAIRLESDDDFEKFLSNIQKDKFAEFEIGQWGKGALEVHFAKDKARVYFRTFDSEAESDDMNFVPANARKLSNDSFAWKGPGTDWQVPIRAVVSRDEALEVTRAFWKKNAARPMRNRWMSQERIRNKR